jgi:hypothetical protein
MAYLDQPQEEQQQPQGQPLQTVSGAGGGTMGGGVQQTANGNRGSGSWTNLQAYTDANREQAGQMAENIRGGLQQARTGAEESIKQSTDKYKDYLSGVGGDVVDKSKWVGSVASGDDPSTPEVETGWYPTGDNGVAGQGFFDKPDVSQWQADPYDIGNINKLSQRIEGTGTEAGRLNELRNLQGLQTTRGEGLLNQLLMQNDPVAAQMFEEQRATPVGAYLPGYEAGAQSSYADTTGLVDRSYDKMGEDLYTASSKLGSDITGMEGYNQQQLDAQNAAMGDWNTNVSTNLAQLQSNPQMLVDMGIIGSVEELAYVPPAAAEDLYNTAARQMAGPAPTQAPGVQITDDMRNRLAVLQELSGQTGYTPTEDVTAGLSGYTPQFDTPVTPEVTPAPVAPTPTPTPTVEGIGGLAEYYAGMKPEDVYTAPKPELAGPNTDDNIIKNIFDKYKDIKYEDLF